MMADQTSSDRVRRRPRRGLVWLVAPLVIFVGMAIIFAFALMTGDPSRLPSALIGKAAPDYDFPPLSGLLRDGQPVAGFGKADRVGGDVAVINFFASWCVPCRTEHPVLEKLKAETGVRMVGINYKDPAPGGLRFLGELGNPYDQVGTDGNGRGAIEWGVYGMPETFVIDGRGRIVFKHVGPISNDSLRRLVIPAIEKTRKAAHKLPKD